MRRRFPVRVITIVLIGLALVAGSSLSAQAATPAAQQVFWKWSDGSEKTSRTFKQSKYGDQAGLPYLQVSTVPASPSRNVYLQFKQKGKWVVENKGTTNRKGILRLGLNPYCSNDTWCDGTYEYRLKVGSLYQTFRITYAER